jgi:hypothetical protein
MAMILAQGGPMSLAAEPAAPIGSTPGPEPVPPALFTEDTIAVRPWVDDVIDTLGFDPRSAYVERFWLGLLGPSTTWLLRRFAAAFDRSPVGFELPLPDLARELGLGEKGGRHSPFVRALYRTCQFRMARVSGPTLEVRRRIPPLTRSQVVRLPTPLRDAHDAWQAAQIDGPTQAAVRRQAKSLALTLLELDPDASAVEQRLASWNVHPAVAREAAGWALERHVEAARVAAAGQ